ncbi:gametogenetin-binding protein 2-like isoform X2 [Anneissia japonica]|uniref:gametogenetin-binding protein 2-like isoform X2 n=1 Tax=Anneissia japonica TaxID=1529436 RepID=UPI001425528D|nr:gametogenetin-binding protein 2-like isoform X2 [Anneissia japonica]
MAKLIAVCAKSAKDKPHKFEERQVPLEVEDNLKMVMQLPTIEKVHCRHNSEYMKDKKFHAAVDFFAKKMALLSRDELAAALLIPSKELLGSMVMENITCVGCRRSIEQMFKRLTDQSLVNALEPLVITARSELSLKPEFLYSPWNMHTLFNVQGCKLTGILDALPRGKKGSKRCALHSLDSHKSKPNGNWIEVWEALEAPCRDEVTLVPATALQVTMETYLRKHRFCTECKSKVMRAYNILIGEIEPTKEKGYCAHLYDGLRCCTRQKHIHLLSETNFIHKLIMRAEPELSGARERHAKTIDVAQEEVLTCLGLHIYDRLHRIGQKLRAEEQTCHLLFHLGVERLRKAFEVTVESKRGMSMLEQVCEEIDEADKLKQQKKEMKKLRRKAKKKGKGGTLPLDVSPENECKCDVDKVEKDDEEDRTECHHHATDLCKCQEESDVNENEVPCGTCGHGTGVCRNDCGYCSYSSPENSEVACTEGICNHDDDNAGCLEECDPCNHDCCVDEICPDCDINLEDESQCCQGCYQESTCGKDVSEMKTIPRNNDKNAAFTCTLQDMLDEGDNDECREFIAEEDIAKFRKEHQFLPQIREELRAKLKRQFEEKFEHHGNGGGRHRCCRSLDKCTSQISNIILK